MEAAEFKEKFIPCKNRYYSIAYRMLLSGEDAADAVQDLYLKLCGMRDKLDKVASPEALGVTMVRNLCIDKLRKKQKQPQNMAEDLMAMRQIVAQEGTNDSELKLQMIEAEIEKMPEGQKRIFYLRYHRDCSVKEISEITGLSSVNVRVILNRLKNNLKKELVNIAV